MLPLWLIIGSLCDFVLQHSSSIWLVFCIDKNSTNDATNDWVGVGFLQSLKQEEKNIMLVVL